MDHALQTSGELPPYSIEQAAQRLQTHPDTVRSAVRNKQLRHFHVGRRVFIPRAYLDRLIAEGPEDAEQA